MRSKRVVVIGAGVAGLVAAVELARRGIEVVVVERADSPGGKLREIEIGGVRIDAGPTVFTMRWVLDEIFADAHASLADYLALRPVETLARHAWSARERLDLYAEIERSAAAIGEFAGAAQGQRYRDFCERVRRIYDSLERPFLRSARPTPLSLVREAGFSGLGSLWRIEPFATMWEALGEYFQDPRLRQLFGRYATYCGSSPFLAPATLMLVAHVERDGVWLVEGGMYRIAEALASLARQRGATLRCAAEAREIVIGGGKVTGVRLATGEEIEAEAVVANADPAALAIGRLGSAVTRAAVPLPHQARSLSALTWTLLARAEGFPLLRHNVFFSGDYAGEFDDIFSHARLPSAPTVYICAQDRGNCDELRSAGEERLLLIVNAPPTGDHHTFTRSEIERCEQQTFGLLERCGLRVDRRPETSVVTTPADFERLFPGTGGALYGQASHGWRASFRRPGARTRIPGLYLAGGATHPGPGVPMAAISGRLAAASLLKDLASTSRFRRPAMPGGTSMP